MATTTAGGGGGGDDRRAGGYGRRGGFQGKGAGEGDKEKEEENNPFKTVWKGKPKTAEDIARLEAEAAERKRTRNLGYRQQKHDKYIKLVRDHPYNPKLQGLNSTFVKAVKADAKSGADKSDSLTILTPNVTASARTPQTTRPVVKANTVNVFRSDGKPMTRENVIDYITPVITEAEIMESILNEDKPQEHTIRFSERRDDAYLIEANTPAAMGFYADALQAATPQKGAPGLRVFRSGDSPHTRRIVGNVYRSLIGLKDKMGRAFAYGTGGAVTHKQVIQYREPDVPTDTGSSLRVYLELDPQAFAWLQTRGWVSRIGVTSVRWRGINISGLTGRFEPSANQYEIRDNLIKTLIETTVAAGTPESQKDADTSQPGSSSSTAEPMETEQTVTPVIPGYKVSASEESQLLDQNRNELIDVSEPSESEFSDNELETTVVAQPDYTPRSRASTPSGDAAKRERTPDNSPQKSEREKKISHSQDRSDTASDVEHEDEDKENHSPN